MPEMKSTHNTDWRIVLHPEVRIREVLNLLARDTHRLHDLKLVLETGRLGRNFALFRLVCRFCAVRGRRRGDGLLLGDEPLEVLAEHFDFTLDLVRGGLRDVTEMSSASCYSLAYK